MLQYRQSSQSKAQIETPGLLKHLQSNAHLWPWVKYLLSKGSLKAPEIEGDLKSRASISRIFQRDLGSKADSFQRSQPDVKSRGGIKAIGLGILQSNAHLWPWVKYLSTKGFIEQEKFLPPAAIVVARTDYRAQFPKKPIARLNIEIEVLANFEKTFSSFQFNASIDQIVMDIPALGGATVILQLLDEEGAILYESSAQNEDQKAAILLTTSVPIMGTSSIGLLLSAAQATAKTFTVRLYGR